MSDGGNGKKPIDLRHVKAKLLDGKTGTKPDLSMVITQEMRVKAANALGDMLKEHARKVLPIKLDVYDLSMLHTLVSIGMKHVAAQNEKPLVDVAGKFREAVFALWLQLGMTYEDCQVLASDIIIMAPKKPAEKKN
jgi:hypothetical protein